MKLSLFDDQARVAARNEKPATASIMRAVQSALNDFVARPYPILNWVGGNDNYAESNDTPMVRRMWYPGSAGTGKLDGLVLVVSVADAASVPADGLRINQADHDQAFSQNIPQSVGVVERLSLDPELWYPLLATTVPIFSQHVSDYSGGTATAREIRVQVAEAGYYGPQIRSGIVFVSAVRKEPDMTGTMHPVIGSEFMPIDHLVSGGEIIGEGPDFRQLASLRDHFNRAWLEKRIQFGGGLCRNGVGTFGQAFNSSGYRYFFDTNYGQGGIAPTVSGPGISVPLRHTSHGRLATVRIYPRIYAKMDAAGSGTIAVYNKADSSTMAGPTTMTNPETVSGSTWQWYPSGDFDGASDPYFLGNADPLIRTDRILLCGGTSSGTMRIAAWSMCVRPSTE